VLPPISRELLDAAARDLATDELPILGMTLENTVSEMAAALGVTPRM
jgi:hypothetical protein